MGSPDSTTPRPPEPVELLRRLVRFDTTNPPGHTSECIAFLDGLLREAGVGTRILSRSPERPNLVARLPGDGTAPPLLLHGHVDVVTTEGQEWTHPPFEGRMENGFLWGRGALDMKGGLAMLLVAFLRAATSGTRLPGDLILAVLSDEETGGDHGAGFLVEEHPGLFEGVRHALGEFGGFSLEVGGLRFYPIQVAEKQICWIRATVRGPAGHGSMPVRGGAMARLARLLRRIDRTRLPGHVTPVVRLMLRAMASELGGLRGLILRLLAMPPLTDPLLGLLGDRGRIFDPLLHNTVSPTVVHASDRINVIPAGVTVELDGRLLPGQRADDLLAEHRHLLGEGVELELLRHDPGPAEPDMALFGTLAGTLGDFDPAGIPVPLLLNGSTDGRHFARLGIQTYGFLPMILPADFDFTRTIHAADERIPVRALEFGTEVISEALHRVGRRNARSR